MLTSPATTTTTKSVASIIPTLDQYTHFHGMWCKPGTAQQCLESFDGGYFVNADLKDAATSETMSVIVPVMTLFHYYALVLVSLTGLSTLLGRTKFRRAVVTVADATSKENNDNAILLVQSKFDDALKVKPMILQRLAQEFNVNRDELSLARHFEYLFDLPLFGLSVMMLHYTSKDGRLFLLEIFRPTNRIVYSIIVKLFSVLTSVGFNNNNKDKKKE